MPTAAGHPPGPSTVVVVVSGSAQERTLMPESALKVPDGEALGAGVLRLTIVAAVPNIAHECTSSM